MVEIVSKMSVLAQQLPCPLPWWIVVWFVALGGAVGSFMNVVIYRMPAGKSIVYPGSRCTRCGNPIRARDNIPVLSWFVLRGRCRDCQAPISARYPLVEAMVAGMFLLVGVFEVLSDGTNLPIDISDSAVTAIGLRIWAVYAYHLLLLCALICITLIRCDRNHVPILLAAPLLITALVAPLFVSLLMPIDVSGVPSVDGVQARPLYTGFVGFLAGTLVCSLTQTTAAGDKANRRGRIEVIFAAALVGSFLGWQAATGLICATSVLYLLAAAFRRACKSSPHVPWLAWLTVATLGYILSWRLIADDFPMLVTEANWSTLGLTGILATCASRLTRMITTYGASMDGIRNQRNSDVSGSVGE